MTYQWIDVVIGENHMSLVFIFMPSSLSYDPKREGHPFTGKGEKNNMCNVNAMLFH